MDRKYLLRGLSVLTLLIAALCTACTNTPKTPAIDRQKEDAVAEYLVSIQDEANIYFAGIAETAVGSKPKEIRIGFRNSDTEMLKGSESLSELLEGNGSVLLVGYISTSEKGYSGDEIHAVILETKKRGLTVNLYFNNNDDYIYQVRTDGVVIDKATGKDGGALREQIPYEFVVDTVD